MVIKQPSTEPEPTRVEGGVTQQSSGVFTVNAGGAARNVNEPLGQPFGRYTLLRRLASGGMGEIFLARQGGQGGFDRLVAIKRILSHYKEDDEHVRMFFDEAKLQALLSDRHIVQIYDMGEIEDHLFIAMEYVHGVSWRRLVETAQRERFKINPAYALDLAVQVCRGLHYAHNVTGGGGKRLNIVHRDINPQNVIVSFDGEVKIIDFGIAKSEINAHQTTTGTLKGKFAYMSPEQGQGAKLDQRSDVFSLGICLYELLALNNPFKRSNVVASLAAIQGDDLPDVRKIRPDCAMFRPILEKACAKEVEDRYNDCGEIADDLVDLYAKGVVQPPKVPMQTWLQTLFEGQINEHIDLLERAGVSELARRSGGGGYFGVDAEVSDPRRRRRVTDPNQNLETEMLLPESASPIGTSPSSLPNQDTVVGVRHKNVPEPVATLATGMGSATDAPAASGNESFELGGLAEIAGPSGSGPHALDPNTAEAPLDPSSDGQSGGLDGDILFGGATAETNAANLDPVSLTASHIKLLDEEPESDPDSSELLHIAGPPLDKGDTDPTASNPSAASAQLLVPAAEPAKSRSLALGAASGLLIGVLAVAALIFVVSPDDEEVLEASASEDVGKAGDDPGEPPGDDDAMKAEPGSAAGQEPADPAAPVGDDPPPDGQDEPPDDEDQPLDQPLDKDPDPAEARRASASASGSTTSSNKRVASKKPTRRRPKASSGDKEVSKTTAKDPKGHAKADPDPAQSSKKPSGRHSQKKPASSDVDKKGDKKGDKKLAKADTGTKHHDKKPAKTEPTKSAQADKPKPLGKVVTRAPHGFKRKGGGSVNIFAGKSKTLTFVDESGGREVKLKLKESGGKVTVVVQSNPRGILKVNRMGASWGTPQKLPPGQQVRLELKGPRWGKPALFVLKLNHH